MSIIFAGTPHFAAVILEKLLQEKFPITAVLTQPDRPKGRGLQLIPSPVKIIGEQHQIPVFQPQTLKSADIESTLKALSPQVIIVVAYGLLFPPSILEIPQYGCVNVHASLLPRWRGAAPIQRAILEGDHSTGICIMKMEAGLDTGPVYSVQEVAIEPDMNAAHLEEQLAAVGASLLSKTLPQILGNTLTPKTQTEIGITYAHKIKKEEYAIHWDMPAVEIARQIRAFAPHPGATTMLGSEIMKILEAKPSVEHEGAPPGTIARIEKDRFFVATSDKTLEITRVQWPGKAAMSVRDFLNSKRTVLETVGCFG